MDVPRDMENIRRAMPEKYEISNDTTQPVSEWEPLKSRIILTWGELRCDFAEHLFDTEEPIRLPLELQ